MNIVRKSYEHTYAHTKRYAIDLSLAENPLGCSPQVYHAIRKQVTAIHRYPSDEHELLEQLAAHHKIPANCIMLGAGANELLEDIIKTYALGRNVVVPAATFPESIACISTLDGAVKKVPLKTDLSIDCDAILQAIDANTSLIHICNPNNPTGIWIPIEEIIALANASSVPIMISEAGADFVKDSVINHLVHKNIIVVRSFSKAYGLAGMRIGYVVADETKIAHLKVNLRSYRINSLAIHAAIAALNDQDHLHKSIQYILNEKESLMSAMNSLGFEVVPSQGQNFIAKVPDIFVNAEGFCRVINLHNSSVIDCSLYQGLEKYIRITPQKHNINEAFINILKLITRR